MYSTIIVIKQGLLFTRTLDIDFDSSDDVFKDDINYDNDEMQENDISSVKHQININILQNCKDLKEKIKLALYDAMMAFELLKDKYKESWILYRIEKDDNIQNNSNFLLASMFHNRCTQSEVSDYLGYLAIPVASTASKKLFSDAENMMIVKRTSLLPTIFEHL
ncbi:13143_t:CDS:2, partial [Cetraspora pellucida]